MKRESEPWQGVKIPDRFEAVSRSEKYLQLRLAERSDRERFEFYLVGIATKRTILVLSLLVGEEEFTFPASEQLARELVRWNEWYLFDAGGDFQLSRKTAPRLLQTFLDELASKLEVSAK
jgi:hypothetical protein